MGQRCTVCSHPRLSQINRDLVLGLGLRQTSQKYAEWGKVSIYALHRHAKAHISDKARTAIIAGQQTRQDAIDLGELRDTTEKRNLADLMFHRNILEAEISRARDLTDFTAIASLEGRLHQNIEQTSRLIGELPSGPQTTINLVSTADDWPQLQSDLLAVARLVPAARQPLLQLVSKRAHVSGIARKTLDAVAVEVPDVVG